MCFVAKKNLHKYIIVYLHQIVKKIQKEPLFIKLFCLIMGGDLKFS